MKDCLIRMGITAKIFQPTWFEFSDLVARFVRWVAVRLMTMAENITLSTDCGFKAQIILDKRGSRQGKINLRRSSRGHFRLEHNARSARDCDQTRVFSVIPELWVEQQRIPRQIQRHKTQSTGRRTLCQPPWRRSNAVDDSKSSGQINSKQCVRSWNSKTWSKGRPITNENSRLKMFVPLDSKIARKCVKNLSCGKHSLIITLKWSQIWLTSRFTNVNQLPYSPFQTETCKTCKMECYGA